MTPLPFLATVRMVGERGWAEGVPPGALGVIVEVYGEDAYEVEFSDGKGITIALLALGRDDLALVDERAAAPAQRSAG